jgi:YVTN family beta-propeller protein
MLAMGLGSMASPAGAAPFAYVVNRGDGTVSVIDTGATPPKVVGAPIAVGALGNDPLGVAVTPETGLCRA